MSLIIQISDTHFGTEQAPVVEALVRLAHEQLPDLLIMSGDITQRARAGQFRAAKLFLDRLNMPASLVIPGNHDIPLFNLFARIFRPYANFQREFGNDLEPVFESDALLAITVKTTRRYRHVNGEISQAQIARVASLLQKAKSSQLRLVITHQPICVTRTEDEHDLLRGHAAATHAWSSAGADIIMGGHIHLPYVCALHESPLHERPLDKSKAELPRRVWALQAGTAVSRRTRDGIDNSVNLIRYDPAQADAVTVERWDYQPRDNCFAIASSQNLQRDCSHVN